MCKVFLRNTAIDGNDSPGHHRSNSILPLDNQCRKNNIEYSIIEAWMFNSDLRVELDPSVMQLDDIYLESIPSGNCT